MGFPRIEVEPYTAADAEERGRVKKRLSLAQQAYADLKQRAEQSSDPAVQAALYQQADELLDRESRVAAGQPAVQLPRDPSALAPNGPPARPLGAGSPVASSGEPLPEPGSTSSASSGGTPPQPAAVGIPGLPTEQQVFEYGMRGSGGNPAEVQRQRELARRARLREEEGQEIQMQSLETQAELASNEGTRVKEALEGGIAGLKQAAEEKQQFAQEQAAAREEYIRGRNERRQALEREQAAQGKSVLASMSDGDRVASAIIVGLGGFAQGFTGSNRNAAYDIIMDAVNHEVDARAARLQAGHAALDEWDRQFNEALKATGSIESAKDETRALLLEGTKLQVEAYGAYFKGQDTAAAKDGMVGKLTEDIAAQDIKLADAAARRAGGSRGSVKNALELVKLVQGINKGQVELQQKANEVVEDLDADGKRRMNLSNAGEEVLLQLRGETLQLLGLQPNATQEQIDAAIKERGDPAVPGHERIGHEPFQLSSRLVKAAAAYPSGGGGMTPAETAYQNRIEMAGIGAYYAISHNSANLTGEQLRAVKSRLNNATLGGVLYAVDQDLKAVRAARRAIPRKNTPRTRAAYDANQGANPTTFPAETDLAPTGGTAMPPGLTRVGSIR